MKFKTSAGRFTLRVVTAWAPPYARRFWQLSMLGYSRASRFYRVDWRDFNKTGLPPLFAQVSLYYPAFVPYLPLRWHHGRIVPRYPRYHTSLSLHLQSLISECIEQHCRDILLVCMPSVVPMINREHFKPCRSQWCRRRSLPAKGTHATTAGGRQQTASPPLKQTHCSIMMGQSFLQ